MVTTNGTTPVAVGIAVHHGPISDMALRPDGRRLLVTNYADDSVSIVDTDTFRVLDTVEGVSEPAAIAVDGARPGRAYVSGVETTSAAYDSIRVIDTGTGAVIATHPLTMSVSDLAADAAGRHVYVTRNGVPAADVAVLDTATGQLQTVDVAGRAPGTTTECVRVSPDGTRAYVATNGPAGGRLVVIGSTRAGLRVIDTVEVGLPVRDVALSPSGALAYVTSSAPAVGVVIDVVDTRTNTISCTRKIGETGGFLTRMALSADGDRAYLVSDDNVTVLCTLSYDILATLGAGTQPSCAVESPDGTRLYIADYSGVVTVTPLTPKAPLALAGATSDTDVLSAAWLVPDLVSPEPAFA
ncbi:hypothetical protein AWC25_16905 [Mycobacterium sherrisii]|nr:hypothetical protein AWC25_16905 [Mycobacterium sherrisii]